MDNDSVPSVRITWKEILIIIIILVVITMMLTPTVRGANESALRTADIGNTKNLATLYRKYRTDTRQVWAYNIALVEPMNPISGNTHFDGLDVKDGGAFTVASFWELARVFDLSPDLFNSPAGEPRVTRGAGIDTTKDWKLVSDIKADIADWSAHGLTDYMLDWSAPSSSGTLRPTLCNRDHASLFGDYINVCFADSHCSSEKDFSIDIGLGTVVHLSIKDEIPDDIMTAVGDEVGKEGQPKVDNTLQLGRGHRRRAMMK